MLGETFNPPLVLRSAFIPLFLLLTHFGFAQVVPPENVIIGIFPTYPVPLDSAGSSGDPFPNLSDTASVEVKVIFEVSDLQGLDSTKVTLKDGGDNIIVDQMMSLIDSILPPLSRSIEGNTIVYGLGLVPYSGGLSATVQLKDENGNNSIEGSSND